MPARDACGVGATRDACGAKRSAACVRAASAGVVLGLPFWAEVRHGRRRDALRRIAKTQREPCQIWRDTYPYLVRRTPNSRAPSDADRRERPIPHIRRPKRPLASRRTPNFVRSPSDPHHATRNRARARCRMPKFPYKGNPEKQTQKRVSVKPAFLYTIRYYRNYTI